MKVWVVAYDTQDGTTHWAAKSAKGRDAIIEEIIRDELKGMSDSWDGADVDALEEFLKAGDISSAWDHFNTMGTEYTNAWIYQDQVELQK